MPFAMLQMPLIGAESELKSKLGRFGVALETSLEAANDDNLATTESMALCMTFSALSGKNAMTL